MIYLKWLCMICVSSFFIKLSDGQRKIINGISATKIKRYMVYLTKGPQSEVVYDAWICGGAIVSPDFIVTSAACVEDVQFMYAIAGYKKYVKESEIDTDQCTHSSRKKVILTCVPKKYDFAYDTAQKWAFIDIAVIKVESPYVFDSNIVPGCSWAPDKIKINYDDQHEKENTDAMVLGWGHTESWRSPNDKHDYNKEELQYGAIRIENKHVCYEAYKSVPGMPKIIDEYMICAMRDGQTSENGIPSNYYPITQYPNVNPLHDEPLSSPLYQPSDLFQYQQSSQPPYEPSNLFQYQQPSPPRYEPLNLPQYQTLNPPQYAPSNPDYTRYQPSKTKIYPQIRPQHEWQSPSTESFQNQVSVQPSSDDDTISFADIIYNIRRTQDNITKVYNITRRTGICQNDHGGPLVSWVGSQEYLIGVSSVFRLSHNNTCIGPFLFTSTTSNKYFLDCFLKKHDEKDFVIMVDSNLRIRRRDGVCSMSPAERGFDIVERRISWRNHPDGPAENELDTDLFARPQSPLI